MLTLTYSRLHFSRLVLCTTHNIINNAKWQNAFLKMTRLSPIRQNSRFINEEQGQHGPYDIARANANGRTSVYINNDNPQGQNGPYKIARLNGQNSHFLSNRLIIPRLHVFRSVPGSITTLRSDPGTPNYKGPFSLFSLHKGLETTKVRSLDNKTVYDSMAALRKTAKTTAGEKSKREDFRKLKDQHGFKEWKILIGPSDWDDHKARKEGAEKYRTQNLPSENGPGIYELAIIISKSDKMSRKLDSSSVFVVYVGKAYNVRTRLQEYGRNGDHLENNKSTNSRTSHNMHELFLKTFSRGHGIACRWVHMDSKEAAESAEKELLKEYDYAWNKHRNGPRREEDIWKRLERPPKSCLFSCITKLVFGTLFHLLQKIKN